MSDQVPRDRAASVAPTTLILAFGAPIAAAVMARVFPAVAAWGSGGGAALLALLGLVPAWMYMRLRAEAGAYSRELHQLALGDLAKEVHEAGDGSMVPLATAMEGLRRVLHQRTTLLGTAVDAQDASVGKAEREIDQLRSAVSEQLTSIDETASSLQEMTISLRSLAEHVDILASASEDASSSVLEMSATNDEVAGNMTTLSECAQESASSIEEMTRSIREVARNIEDLSSTTEETSSSMNEMDISIQQVESNANETARLSEEVARAAGLGVEAINQTIAGINLIKDSSGEAVQVIEKLGAKISEIGKIIEVIDDVAEQTNLLALNAAIIAAQAGEHGKGFAVVADEIKDLAERAGASTKEIADLVKTVQHESVNAVEAVQKGARSVDEGVKVSHEAEDALRRILESAERSTQMVSEIARATIEQARGSKQVAGAINRIAETVQQISNATGEQASGSESIMRAAERMLQISKSVERSTQELGAGSKQITQSIESISDMVSRLSAAHREQSSAADNILAAVDTAKGSVHEQEAHAGELARTVDSFRSATAKVQKVTRLLQS